jgi:hypothetical protein
MLLLTLKKKLARVKPSFYSEQASEWIKATAQDLCN